MEGIASSNKIILHYYLLLYLSIILVALLVAFTLRRINYLF